MIVYHSFEAAYLNFWNVEPNHCHLRYIEIEHILNGFKRDR